MAGMVGAKMVAGRGNGGLSTSGSGTGGGGTGFGHIYGAGNLDTGGRGTHGKGRGPKLAERGEREVSVGMGQGGGEADGSLSKEAIAKVVRAHMAGVKYCYEKELQHKSGLSGGVDIFWVIQPDGSVSKASVKSTTLSDAATEGCILRQVKQWQFPKAPGQTIVGRFPFIFKGEDRSRESAEGKSAMNFHPAGGNQTRTSCWPAPSRRRPPRRFRPAPISTRRSTSTARRRCSSSRAPR